MVEWTQNPYGSFELKTGAIELAVYRTESPRVRLVLARLRGRRLQPRGDRRWQRHGGRRCSESKGGVLDSRLLRAHPGGHCEVGSAVGG